MVGDGRRALGGFAKGLGALGCPGRARRSVVVPVSAVTYTWIWDGNALVEATERDGDGSVRSGFHRCCWLAGRPGHAGLNGEAEAAVPRPVSAPRVPPTIVRRRRADGRPWWVRRAGGGARSRPELTTTTSKQPSSVAAPVVTLSSYPHLDRGTGTWKIASRCWARLGPGQNFRVAGGRTATGRASAADASASVPGDGRSTCEASRKRGARCRDARLWAAGSHIQVSFKLNYRSMYVHS
jgi:hypothetical protein